jgi:hypothetical protein
MRKMLLAASAVAALAMAAPMPASAQHWRHGWHHRWHHGWHRVPNVILRFGGPFRHHYASCWYTRRFWRHGWHWRRVWVC